MLFSTGSSSGLLLTEETLSYILASVNKKYIKDFLLQLFGFQSIEKQKIYNAWGQGFKCPLEVLPTGAGKTVLFTDILKEHKGPSCALAHRQELVTQISLALGRHGVRHRVEGPKDVVKLANRLHMEELGTSYVDPMSRCAVIGVDTLNAREDQLRRWAESVTLWVGDEGHHYLRSNKWGRAIRQFSNPNVKGLLVTATPERADGKGLGAHAHGFADILLEGPTMRDLISMGFLTDYRIIAPPTTVKLSDQDLDKSGDFSRKKASEAVRRAQITGDVVKHYRKYADGKLGVTFAVDVEEAKNIAAAFNRAGIKAAVVHAKTPTADRIRVLRKFKNREIMQLVNVDLFGEGFDLPAIEVVSMARPTQSYALYAQQFGRALRIMAGKDKAIIIDHVGNVERHYGPPDRPRVWSLDDRPKRSREFRGVPMRTCLADECFNVYERHLLECPYCGTPIPEPEGRSGPEFVDGDLVELTPEALARLRGDMDKIDKPVEEYAKELYAKHAQHSHVLRHCKIHSGAQEMQEALRNAISWWAAIYRDRGEKTREIQKRFYLTFGIDILTAQGLRRAEAEALADKIYLNMGAVLNEFRALDQKVEYTAGGSRGSAPVP